MFDRAQNQYIPTIAGLGMHVEVKDPEEKIVMSRVRWWSSNVHIEMWASASCPGLKDA